MPNPPAMLFTFLALSTGLVFGGMQVMAARIKIRPPRTTLLLAILVAATFAIQVAEPRLLPLMERNAALVERNEIWRAVTALFVQDGWVPGALFNIATLLLIGSVAEQRLSARRWLVIYLCGGILTELLALGWQPQGAGNSIAVFALAGGLIAFDVKRTRSNVQAAVVVIGIIAGIGLLVMRDVHGLGFVSGAVIGAMLSMKDDKQEPNAM